MSNPIKLRHYYALSVRLASPLSVSGGQSEFTDADVLVNGGGQVFVPGTSLAGAMRNFLEQDKREKSILGFADGNDAKMSSVFISDLYFKENHRISVRDRVALTEEKTVSNKFDMEIIESGAEGVLYLNYVVREAEEKETFETCISSLFQAIQGGEIRFGSNKNRGFGRIQIKTIYQKKFSYEKGKLVPDLEQWIAFKHNWKDLDSYGRGESYESWSKKQQDCEEKYVKIKVPLKLTGGISIRTYSADPQKADFSHITCNQEPVIPGNSWNGAIRDDVRRILLEVGKTEREAASIMERWFGTVSQDKEKTRQSRLVVGESMIRGGTMLPVTRNSVNRFDASTKEGALYSEIACFGGETDLELMVKKDEQKDYCALIGMMTLVIEDIQKGYVAVGGQTAIGRGIFQADESRGLWYSQNLNLEECMTNLCMLLGKEEK